MGELGYIECMQKLDYLRIELLKTLDQVINGERDLPSVDWRDTNIPIFKFKNGIHIDIYDKDVYFCKGDIYTPDIVYIIPYGLEIIDKLDKVFILCSKHGKVEKYISFEDKEFEDIKSLLNEI